MSFISGEISYSNENSPRLQNPESLFHKVTFVPEIPNIEERLTNIENALLQLNENLTLLLGKPHDDESSMESSSTAEGQEFDTTKCYNFDQMPDGQDVRCPLPQLVGERYCERHIVDYNEFMEELELYILDKLGTPNREKTKTLERGWKGMLLEELGLSAAKVGKIIKENEGKSAKEIAKIIDTISVEI